MMDSCYFNGGRFMNILHELKPNSSYNALKDVASRISISDLAICPVWFRLRYFQMTVSSDKNTNWDRLNIILESDTDQYDYNMFDRIESISDLDREVDKCIDSYVNNGPWRQINCRSCNNKFIINSRKIFQLRSKEYKVPSLCNECKSKREPIAYSTDKGNTETAMEIALRKAGIIK